MPQGEVSTKRIGDILIEKGFLKQDQLAKALEVQKQSGSRLGQTLLFMGIITEDQLADCLAQQLGIPYIAIRHHQVQESLLKLVPHDVAKRFRILPLDRIGNILTVAISDGMAPEEKEELEKLTSCKIKYFFVTASDFKTAYAGYYPGQAP